MKSKNRMLAFLSQSARKTLKVILESKADTQEWDEYNEDLQAIKTIGKRITGLDLSSSDQIELYLEIYLWGAKVERRRRGEWDDDMSFLTYDEMLKSEL